jgi:hypothetical protein
MSMRKWTVVAVALLVFGLSVQPAEAGFFGKVWELEKKKNAWIMRTFFGVGKKPAPRQQHQPHYNYYTPQQYVAPTPTAPAAGQPAIAPQTSQVTPGWAAPYRVAAQPSAKAIPAAPAVELATPVEVAPHGTAAPRGAYIPPAPAID